MPGTRSLPEGANLDQLKREAKQLQTAHRDRNLSVAARIVGHHPRWKGRSFSAALDRSLPLTDAQLVLAREYGYWSWAELKRWLEVGPRVAQVEPHPRFAEALTAFDAGDTERLARSVAGDPTLLHARTNLEPPYGYFTGATLLHHAAGNPGRKNPLAKNVVELARVLLQAGADPNAGTLGNGTTTMGLVLTSKHASDANLSGPLIDLLLGYGARLDLTRGAVVVPAWGDRYTLDLPLTNFAPRAAEKLVAFGAHVDVCAAAGLGRMDLLRDCFDRSGRLRARPTRAGRVLSDRDAIGLALLFAYYNRQPDAVDLLLEKDGNWDMIGADNGTALHCAAWDGDLAMVQRLIAKGADLSNRENRYVATPLSWAQHNKQTEVFDWFRAHCAIDLHDAVGFDLREHVEARLREDPGSVNRRIDHWDIPFCTPLHWAVWTQVSDVDGTHSYDLESRGQLVQLLLDHGADPNALAGNGCTPLDVARACDAAPIVALLEEHGAKSATEL